MSEFGVVDHLLNYYESLLLPPAPDESTFYAWEPLPMSEFLPGITRAREWLIERNKCWTGEESFLDVGAGIGTKLAVASLLGWTVEGCEHHVPYIELASRLFPHVPITLGEAFDFDRYDEFDVVYSYRLCVDDDKQRELTQWIVQQMRSGSLFFSPCWQPEGLRPLGAQVWAVD